MTDQERIRLVVGVRSEVTLSTVEGLVELTVFVDRDLNLFNSGGDSNDHGFDSFFFRRRGTFSLHHYYYTIG